MGGERKSHHQHFMVLFTWIIIISDHYRKCRHPRERKNIKREIKEGRVIPFLLWEDNENHDNNISN